MKTIFSSHRKHFRFPKFTAVWKDSGGNVTYRSHASREERERFSDDGTRTRADLNRWRLIYAINVFPKDWPKGVE